MQNPLYEECVFINCPLDDKYHPLFLAKIFAIFDCGYQPRCALEISDGTQTRITKIADLISKCKFGIHDISRTQVAGTPRLPRFNMPLELGIFLGAKSFGQNEQREKVCLVLDSERYRYARFISDIGGQDIEAHENNELKMIRIIRNWLNHHPRGDQLPAGSAMVRRYTLFKSELPSLCKELGTTKKELTACYTDYAKLVSKWVKRTA